MALLVIQHAADCGPAHLGRWLAETGVELDVVRCWAGEPVPGGLEGYAGLLVLGGDMGAYDDAVAPWLAPTRDLLAAAVAADTPTLAVCLGHQLLAVAAGGRVQRSPAGRQLGVLPLGLTGAGAEDPLLGPAGAAAAAIHWNDDLVTELPPGAVLLAATPDGIQAMRLGTNVWGVQFHPEIGAREIATWAASGALAADIPPDQLRSMTEAEPTLHRTWREFAHRFAAALSGSPASPASVGTTDTPR